MHVSRQGSSALTPHQREVLEMHYEHGLPFSIIGVICGVSRQAARQCHERAIAQLRRCPLSVHVHSRRTVADVLRDLMAGEGCAPPHALHNQADQWEAHELALLNSGQAASRVRSTLPNRCYEATHCMRYGHAE